VWLAIEMRAPPEKERERVMRLLRDAGEVGRRTGWCENVNERERAVLRDIVTFRTARSLGTFVRAGLYPERNQVATRSGAQT
jgi:hypothetical protein